ncbi:hypothetical protein C8P63_1499 [Melghirimyces profundicolus]|uniref:Helix-turn-helix domain-containing protein n=1 Tax=Melghirimyces profundicolus TaxID=1242148 RepID=A0A2T6AVK7_9BACL|nr:hypothetical protein [Melghirimyces profundicolus]PTX47844.1 hypothetical protein C8P63_1499 [Melghirimyces profundicolus]
MNWRWPHRYVTVKKASRETGVPLSVMAKVLEDGLFPVRRGRQGPLIRNVDALRIQRNVEKWPLSRVERIMREGMPWETKERGERPG